MKRASPDKPKAPPFALPNHSWRPLDWIKPEWRQANAGRIIRDCGNAVLIRRGPLDWKDAGFQLVSCKPGTKRGTLPNEKSNAQDNWFGAVAQINSLAQKAGSGDERALSYLCGLTGAMVKTLNQLALDKPELIRPIARIHGGWPVMKSARDRLTEKEKELLGSIELGSKALLEFHPATAKWIVDDGSRIAFMLLSRIDRARQESPHFDFKPLSTIAKKLDPFTDASAAQWWKLARAVLLASYPNPETVLEFQNLVTDSKRRTPGRTRARILEILRARFLSFAPNKF